MFCFVSSRYVSFCLVLFCFVLFVLFCSCFVLFLFRLALPCFDILISFVFCCVVLWCCALFCLFYRLSSLFVSGCVFFLALFWLVYLWARVCAFCCFCLSLLLDRLCFCLVYCSFVRLFVCLFFFLFRAVCSHSPLGALNQPNPRLPPTSRRERIDKLTTDDMNAALVQGVVDSGEARPPTGNVTHLNGATIKKSRRSAALNVATLIACTSSMLSLYG